MKGSPPSMVSAPLVIGLGRRPSRGSSSPARASYEHLTVSILGPIRGGSPREYGTTPFDHERRAVRAERP